MGILLVLLAWSGVLAAKTWSAYRHDQQGLAQLDAVRADLDPGQVTAASTQQPLETAETAFDGTGTGRPVLAAVRTGDPGTGHRAAIPFRPGAEQRSRPGLRHRRRLPRRSSPGARPAALAPDPNGSPRSSDCRRSRSRPPGSCPGSTPDREMRWSRRSPAGIRSSFPNWTMRAPGWRTRRPCRRSRPRSSRAPRPTWCSQPTTPRCEPARAPSSISGWPPPQTVSSSWATSAPRGALTLPVGAVTATGDLERNWGWLLPGVDFRNLGVTPQFDVTAPLAARMWRAATGQHVDGVLAIDVAGLQQFLEATGPVRWTARPSGPPTSSSVLLHDQYAGLSDSTRPTHRTARTRSAPWPRRCPPPAPGQSTDLRLAGHGGDRRGGRTAPDALVDLAGRPGRLGGERGERQPHAHSR